MSNPLHPDSLALAWGPISIWLLLLVLHGISLTPLVLYDSLCLLFMPGYPTWLAYHIHTTLARSFVLT